MTFKRLAEYFSQLEATALRNKMVEILASLFDEASMSEAGKICYLLQGRVSPLFKDIEFGLADRMVIRAISQGLGVTRAEITKKFKAKGDLGIVVESLKEKTSAKRLDVGSVYQILFKIAKAGGEGSQEVKINLLGGLLKEADPLSARYLVRIPLCKLRLGFSDMTILDSLSWMIAGNKSLRPVIERAYHVRPDLSLIATAVKKNGVDEIKKIKPSIGTPIIMARANRLTSSKEILEKIGKCAIEFKYDGLRVQVHKKGDKIYLFSRNLEDLTPMFPDIIKAIKRQVSSNEAIFEGEIVAYNPKTNVTIAFQQTMQRRRKYNIQEKAAEIPVKLFVFELLYLSGKNLIQEPYSKRKLFLKKIIEPDNTIIYAQETITNEEKIIDTLFKKAVNEGFEGIIAKRLVGAYQAGMRGWNWIKFKRAMSHKLMDTFDVVVMGYTKGEGKRTIFGVGEFLTGVYDEKKDQFATITKIGTGLTDQQFRELKQRVTKLEVPLKPQAYDVEKLLEVDVWLKPSLVVEVGADEITRSQVHTAGRVMGPSKSGTALEVREPGFSLRFPRLMRFRDDRKSVDATTVTEVKEMYKLQGKSKK